MEAAKPAGNTNKSIKDNIFADLRDNFKKVLNNHLDDRVYNENKIKTWINNILFDTEDYFAKKYPDYDIFLHCFVSQNHVYFNVNVRQIFIEETDGSDWVSFKNDNMFCILYFFFYKRYKLDYNLQGIESDIIKKGNELTVKYLEDRKYNPDKNVDYINHINIEHIDYILNKKNKSRCFAVTIIFKNPIKGKYDFNYLSHGKDVYKTMFQSYQNESLLCTHDIYFFK